MDKVWQVSPTGIRWLSVSIPKKRMAQHMQQTSVRSAHPLSSLQNLRESLCQPGIQVSLRNRVQNAIPW